MGDNEERVFLAAGCTWTLQPLLTAPEGVISTRTGFMGGATPDPVDGNCGDHAETTEVVFDPVRLTFRGLLEVYFQVHRPDLGANIVGSQYRSEIFYTTSDQRSVALETIADVEASGYWPGKPTTRVSEASQFWPDPLEEQHYLARFPHGCKPPFPRRVAAVEACRRAARDGA
jgi:peptide-methionine (S)-S-oxide reductase